MAEATELARMQVYNAQVKQEKELLKVDWKNISIWSRGMDWE